MDAAAARQSRPAFGSEQFRAVARRRTFCVAVRSTQLQPISDSEVAIAMMATKILRTLLNFVIFGMAENPWVTGAVLITGILVALWGLWLVGRLARLKFSTVQCGVMAVFFVAFIAVVGATLVPCQFEWANFDTQFVQTIIDTAVDGPVTVDEFYRSAQPQKQPVVWRNLVMIELPLLLRVLKLSRFRKSGWTHGLRLR